MKTFHTQSKSRIALNTLSAFAGVRAGMSVIGIMGILVAQPVFADADPCSSVLDSSIDTSNSSFLTSTHDSRMMTMCEFRDAVVSEYSNFDLKAERIKNPDGTAFDSLAHLNQCIALENLVTTDNSDLHFLDRVSQCIAGFHDSHFWTAAPVALPPVFAGLMLTNIGGKYYISEIMPQVLAYVDISATGSASLEKGLAVGNEVTEVDGQSPAALSAHYATYISGSSTDYITQQADLSIFFRTFDYPTKNSVQLKIQDAAGNSYDLRLPWWGGVGAHTRADSFAYFQQLGIPLSDQVKIVLDPKTGSTDWRTVSLQTSGYDATQPLFKGDNYNDLVEYADDTGAPGLRVGEVVAPGGAAFCYMELLTFETTNFTGKDKSQASFGDTIRNFISDCEQKQLDLVLDLRSNPGGNGDFPDLLLSILTEKGKSYPSPVMAFRITPDTGKLLASDTFQPQLNFEDLGAFLNNPIDIYNKAADANQKESDIVPNAVLGADAAVGGYEGRILALITPDCVSACDMTASLLKKSGRAVLLGTHSNGTGAGFLSSASLNSTFQDSNYELAIKIPNFLFGVPDKMVDQVSGAPWAANESNYMLENHPTAADVQYTLSTADLNPSSPALGWEIAVFKELSAMETPPAAASASAPVTAASVGVLAPKAAKSK
jgi:hypothetical protein